MKILLCFLSIIPTAFLLAQGHPFDLERLNNVDLSKNVAAPALFYEVKGLVCMEAEHAQGTSGWRRVRGETGTSMLAEETGLGTGVLAFDIHFENPDDYAVWILGRKALDQPHHKGNRVMVLGDRHGENATLLKTDEGPTFMNYGPYSEISLGTNYISRWFSGPEGENKPKQTAGGLFDFENPGCVALFREKIKSLFDDGLDFFKLDGTSWLPAMKALFECTQQLGLETRGRGLIMTHKTGVDNSAYKRYPVKWSSDTKAAWTTPHWPNYLNEWSHGGFKENIEMVANPRLYTYDIPFLTHDGMGFKEFDSRDVDDEYYSRYCQFGCFNTVFEVFSSMTNPRHNFPFKMGKTAQNNFRTYTHLRMQLFPYIYTHAHLTRLTGKKMVRGDGVHLTQYRFGDAFLVAPVHQKWARTRNVWLPTDKVWFNYWTGEKYHGGQTVTIAAPVARLPLFVRAGSIIPMRDYARSIELGSNAKLTLDIFPLNESSFTLYEDDGLSNDYLHGRYATTTYRCRATEEAITFVIQPIEGKYNGMLENREYMLQFHLEQPPRQVMVNGQIVEFAFDSEKGLLRVPVSHRTRDRVAVELYLRRS